MALTAQELLRHAVEQGASDLHVSVGAPPVMRIQGILRPVTMPDMTADDTLSIIRDVLQDSQWNTLVEAGEIDLSYSVSGLSRFRINAYRQRGCYSMAVRIVAGTVPAFESLGLPTQISMWAGRSQGLVLVTGPTGSGKSTTLASLIALINQTQERHIITLEDPIEYLHRHGKSVIDQREIGTDTKSFATGLRAALRQDPDVLLVGELRDLETIATALTAAETGHLVFATLHTPDAPQSIDRMIDVFPAAQQQQVRVQLASSLQGIVSQRLIQTSSGGARVAATEILVNTPAVSNLIRTEKVHQIRSAMQTGKAHGMQTMDMSLRELVSTGQITDAQARQYAAAFAQTLF